MKLLIARTMPVNVNKRMVFAGTTVSAATAVFAAAAAGALALAACSDDSGTDIDYPDPFDAVDVFVGTGGDGYGVGSALPGASMPFSLVKLSPESAGPNGRQVSYSHCAGYAYDETTILGFAHTHMHGIGVPGYGAVLFTPVRGMSQEKTGFLGYMSSFSHDTEQGEPGYYAVTLEEPGVRAELSAGMRVGYHRYTWPADIQAGEAALVIDLGHVTSDGEVLGSHIEVIGAERRVRGWVDNDGMHGRRHVVYFDAVFDRDFTARGVWQDGAVDDGGQTADGTHVGGWLVFDTSAGPAGGPAVEAQVGISYTGMEGARLNREAEQTAGFDDARARARAAWEGVFALIEVEGGTLLEYRIFYSALYHAFQHPTAFSDADGSYHGFDGQIHQDARTFYSDFSLWDTYRTLHPLLILLVPEESADMAQSFVRMYEQWGGLPRWPLATSDSGSMIGTSADVVLSETWLKGITDFDIDTAWEAMWANATGSATHAGRGGAEDYLNLGYVAADHHSSSVSRTQEFAWDDFALANLAEALGRAAEAAQLSDQSRTIRHLWHDQSRFFRGRNADGSWAEPFADTEWEDYYCEGDAWQHLWLTPHVDLLAELMGGMNGVLDRLTEFFDLTLDHWEWNQMGLWAPLPYYWHGNEPDLHAAYYFAAAGRPSSTQRWVRWIMDTFYNLGPDGLAGNDDAGTRSAWYIFSALGFYPLAGSDRYIVGTPAFDRAAVHLSGGDLIIEASDLDRGHYVQSVDLNGAPLAEPWILHSDILNGGTIRFRMGGSPSTWGEP